MRKALSSSRARSRVVPRNARAAKGLGSFDVFDGPDPGFAEQVYLFELLAEHGAGLAGPDAAHTLAMLRDRDGGKAVVLRFDRTQLPAFTLWKNTGGLKSGYVTGLEPGTNYPNPKPFEKARGRVVTIPPGGSFVTETTLEVLNSPDRVAAVAEEIHKLQAQSVPVIHKAPVEPFTED